eukprot:751476-Hanusia_phi.AAC.7
MMIGPSRVVRDRSVTYWSPRAGPGPSTRAYRVPAGPITDRRFWAPGRAAGGVPYPVPGTRYRTVPAAAVAPGAAADSGPAGARLGSGGGDCPPPPRLRRVQD